jgi:hypothetical protein
MTPSSRTFTIIALLPLALVAGGGCAHYEYDLVAPQDLARRIGSGAFETVRVDPLEYRLRTVENRLVMEIYNPDRDPVTVVGERSYVVDPRGQSHPVRGQTAAPNAYIRMILPPMRPGYYQSHPSIGLGVGFGFSSAHHYGGFGGRYPGYYDPFFYDEPRYYTYYDESDATYFNWEGETDARLHLVYQRGPDTFTHDFTFHRKKV